MRSYYSDFVTHCMKFYVRYPDPKFKSEAEKKNWYACQNALKDCSDTERDMIVAVYANGDTISDSVYQAAKKFKVKQDVIWNLLNDLERKVAKRRGLM